MKKKIATGILTILLSLSNLLLNARPETTFSESGKSIVACIWYLDINDPDNAMAQATNALDYLAKNEDPYMEAYGRIALGLSYLQSNTDREIGIRRNISMGLDILRVLENTDLCDYFITEAATDVLSGNGHLKNTQSGAISYLRRYCTDNQELTEKNMIGLLILKRLLNLNPEKEALLNATLRNIAAKSGNPVSNARAMASTTFSSLRSVAKDTVSINDSLIKTIIAYYSYCIDNDATNPVLPKICFQSPEIKPLEDVLTRLGGDQAPKLFANIEIGASGVKFSVISFSTYNKEGDYDFEIIDKGAIGTEFATLTDDSYNNTISQVLKFKDTVINKHHVLPDRIIYSISSGALAAAKDAYRGTVIDTLISDIKRQTNSIIVNRVDVRDEIAYTLLGVLPRIVRLNENDELYDHMILDIGTGNTKGGFFMGSTESFQYFSSEWACGKVLNSVSAETNLPDFTNKVQLVVNDAMKKPGTNSQSLRNILRSSGYSNCQNIILTGGIFWAIAYRIKPYEAVTKDKAFVKLTLQDIKDFKKKLLENYEAFIDYKQYLYLFDKPEDREKLKEEFLKIKREFSIHKSIAGATLAESIITELDSSPLSKVYRFAKNGVVGWTTGYIIKYLGELLK